MCTQNVIVYLLLSFLVHNKIHPYCSGHVSLCQHSTIGCDIHELGDRQVRGLSKQQCSYKQTLLVATCARTVHDYSMAHSFMPPLEVLSVERAKNQAG